MTVRIPQRRVADVTVKQVSSVGIVRSLHFTRWMDPLNLMSLSIAETKIDPVGFIFAKVHEDSAARDGQCTVDFNVSAFETDGRFVAHNSEEGRCGFHTEYCPCFNS